MLRVLLAILTGLVGAALLHLVIIFSLPSFSERDAHSQVMNEGPEFRFHIVGAKPDRAGLAKQDPFLEIAVCAFDITDQPVRLTSANGVPFWSMATFDSASNETFSINDRTAADRTLDVILATPVQATALRKALASTQVQPIIVETAQVEGYAVLRALVPQQSFREAALQFLTKADCSPMEWE
ncbi:DUF1254 domain-containing protein [Rhizobium lemnae]|uniref:DUF1254 domain-containing protein n=1 Tax=Rhizobium lemnae TaxID=1214924 RepID=A0ABV8E3E7_9HYPH|nr:DUF1254 domain-containing protein [Rhizobium lemnae]MCJ8507549.1 DUF1254 domain-containing protein [Rhizobium lemnae]